MYQNKYVQLLRNQYVQKQGMGLVNQTFFHSCDAKTPHKRPAPFPDFVAGEWPAIARQAKMSLTLRAYEQHDFAALHRLDQACFPPASRTRG